MTGYTPVYQIPYAVPGDKVNQYPVTSKGLADRLEATLLDQSVPPAGHDVITLTQRVQDLETSAANWDTMPAPVSVQAPDSSSKSVGGNAWADWSSLSASITFPVRTLVLVVFQVYAITSGAVYVRFGVNVTGPTDSGPEAGGLGRVIQSGLQDGRNEAKTCQRLVIVEPGTSTFAVQAMITSGSTGTASGAAPSLDVIPLRPMPDTTSD